MTTRRDFLGLTAGAGMGAMLPLGLGHSTTLARKTARLRAALAVGSPKLAKFVDALPVPGVVQPIGMLNGQPYYDVSITQFSQQLHRDLLPTTVWGYAGSFPGPSFEASPGTPIYVKWRNDLPTTHLLPIDTVNVHGANAGEPAVRAVTHLHGGHVPSASDGGPDAWYTPELPGGGFATVGSRFDGDTFYYPNNQLGTTLWYHDHALGITRLNVYAGLAGFYLLRDPAEAALNLPSGAYEIPIVFQDRTFNKDGSLFYPPPPTVPEFFGDTMVVNGKVWPKLTVQARKYRFRFLNGCNSRFLRMRLIESDLSGTAPSSPNAWNRGPDINVIGTDGGLLPAPAMANPLIMGPGERCDVVIDFTGWTTKAGKPKWYLLYNDAGTPFSNTPTAVGAIPEVMLFEVVAATSPDTSDLPASLVPLPRLDPATASTTRFVTLEEMMMGKMLIALLNGVHYDAPTTESPVLGTTEVWNIINLTPDTHPIHLHQTMFQVLDRQLFDAVGYMAAKGTGAPIDPTPFFRGPAAPPDPYEDGWKDTVRANPNEVTRIVAKFEDYAGFYVWHCHILEHEDHEMMRPLEVQPAPVP
ncbi:MAG TPA: multicopper oxidase [Gemmatimonadaceae bacterium]